MRDKVILKFGSSSNVQNIIARSCSGDKVQLSTIYSDLINQNAQVTWSKTIWDDWSFPKHSLITWLATHSRLLTRDRLCHMNILDMNHQQNACVLCTFQQQETCKHLFFECAFSADLWNRVMEWMNFKWKSCNWDRIIEWYSTRLKGKGFMKRIKRVALTVSVYAIWKERNQRIFRQESQDLVSVFRRVKILILSKVLNDDIPAHIKDRIVKM
ncbi:uncharacterized protein LOC109841482 [Asparagus officinalis]|uniref:uncharacterized protein LOC109841482 n=1 Tax=Asparagus officinalis TaxID=4686 RepID=UPI00098E1036|nr:uncharacterized protein LOC109841482 [Asparagus officinalis]